MPTRNLKFVFSSAIPFVAAAAGAIMTGSMTGCETTSTTTSTTAGSNAGTQDAAAMAETPARLTAGDRVPAVTVQTASGDSVPLDRALGNEGKTVLVFYRGGWCPYCNQELAAWQENLSRLKALGYNLVAITPEAPEQTSSTATKNDLDFTILSDASHAAAEAFGISFTLTESTVKKYRGYGIDLDTHNASGEWKLPHRGTYVVDADGTIREAWILEDYTRYTKPQEVLNTIATFKS